MSKEAKVKPLMAEMKLKLSFKGEGVILGPDGKPKAKFKMEGNNHGNNTVNRAS